MDIQGKVAIITGGARGLGRFHALHLAKLGINIAVVDLSLKSYQEYDEKIAGETVVEEIKSLGVDAIGIEADVSDKTMVNSSVEKTLEKFGHIDFLINNAGGLMGHPEESYASSVSEKDLKKTLEVNLFGTIYYCQAVAEPMKKQKYGRIVNTSSHGGLWSQPHGIYASYGTAKSGIIHYTRYLAQELAPFGITVNCIAPGFISTSRLETIAYKTDGHASRDKVLAQIPMGRIGLPEDVSKVIQFFISDLSDYVTGQCLSVCGGLVRF